MKTKTQVEKQLQRKSSPEIVETIIASKKNEKWLNIGGMISGPRRKRIDINLGEINKQAKDGDIIVVPGKVLSQGELTKKIKIVALSFSEKAKENILKSKCDFSSILNEIKKNPEAKGINILR